jgi:3-oxoacyl-[acyl-carrier protein] reductase
MGLGRGHGPRYVSEVRNGGGHHPMSMPADSNARSDSQGALATYQLTGKTALVTGGASGIGLATVQLLTRSGAKVAVNYLPEDVRGQNVISELTAEGMSIVGAPGDVSDERGAETMVLRAIESLGRLDLLVNNAGTPATRKSIAPDQFDLITEDLWRVLVNTNLVSVFRCTRAARAALTASGGAVVNTASLSGIDSVGSSIAYAATKAGVINLTKNLARALAPRVRVNAIAPGAVDSTWMVEWTDEQKTSSKERALLKRRCRPDDLARAIAFLGFDAPMITGQTVVVDAGISLGG